MKSRSAPFDSFYYPLYLCTNGEINTKTCMPEIVSHSQQPERPEQESAKIDMLDGATKLHLVEILGISVMGSSGNHTVGNTQEVPEYRADDAMLSNVPIDKNP